MKTRWSKEQINEWYRKQGWLRGCNFIGSDCSSRIDQWQSYKRDEHLQTAERELKLCQEIGFNTIRWIIEFDVWYQERETFMETLEMYIALAAKYGQKVMLCMAHEAVMCREEKYVCKPLGEQPYALGYHQGRWPLSEEELAKKPYHALEREETREAYLEMVREIVHKYANDERVLCWNVYNEPGIGIGERSIPLLDMMFDAIRSQDPIQPLGADVWRSLDENLQIKSKEEAHALELSDFISYHSYEPYERMVPELKKMQQIGRPIFMTEWLCRPKDSNIRELYPLFYMENIANYCWGFVVGKTQTQEPWTGTFEAYEKNPDSYKYDFTKWHHDLFRPNLYPYDPKEIKLIRRYNALAEGCTENTFHQDFSVEVFQ